MWQRMTRSADITQLVNELDEVASAGILDWVYDSKRHKALRAFVSEEDDMQAAVHAVLESACAKLDTKWSRAASHFFGCSAESQNQRSDAETSVYSTRKNQKNKGLTERSRLAADELGSKSSRWFRTKSRKFDGRTPREGLVLRVAETMEKAATSKPRGGEGKRGQQRPRVVSADGQLVGSGQTLRAADLADFYKHFEPRKVASLDQLLRSSKVPFDNMEVELAVSPGPKRGTLTLSVVEEFDAHFDRMLIMHAIARDRKTYEPNEPAARIYAESGDILNTYWYMDRANLLSSFERQLADDRFLKVVVYRRNNAGHWVQRSLKKKGLTPDEIANLGAEWDVPLVDTDDLRIMELRVPSESRDGHRRYRTTSKFIVEMKPKFCFWEFDRISYVNSVRVKIVELHDTKFRVRFFGPAVDRHIDLDARTWEYSITGWCMRHNGINIHW